MKVSPTLSLVYLCFSATIDVAVSQNPQGCLTSVEPNKDYFPDKVSPEYSKLWSVSYHNTYKVVKNLDADATYVLYQCGTEPPLGIPANLTLSIPLEQGIALTTTPLIPHFELLGLRDHIKAYLGDPKWISSPCLNDRISSGETVNVRYPSDANATDGLMSARPDIVVFGTVEGAGGVPNVVVDSAWKEGNNHGIGEWHKFHSVFFNLEAKGSEDFNGIRDRYECTKKNANTVLKDKTEPKVVFAEFSTYCGGWAVGNCPSFSCDFVTDCASSILANDKKGSVINPICGEDYVLKTTAEFVEFAKDADIWIYPGHGDYYWDTAYADFGDELDQMKSVQNKQVYDTVLTALNTWYEHRLVEYGKLPVVCMLRNIVLNSCAVFSRCCLGRFLQHSGGKPSSLASQTRIHEKCLH